MGSADHSMPIELAQKLLLRCLMVSFCLFERIQSLHPVVQLLCRVFQFHLFRVRQFHVVLFLLSPQSVQFLTSLPQRFHIPFHFPQLVLYSLTVLSQPRLVLLGHFDVVRIVG